MKEKINKAILEILSVGGNPADCNSEAPPKNFFHFFKDFTIYILMIEVPESVNDIGMVIAESYKY